MRMNKVRKAAANIVLAYALVCVVFFVTAVSVSVIAIWQGALFILASLAVIVVLRARKAELAREAMEHKQRDRYEANRPDA
jgi:ABC-type transport system involved in cytochrome bd biosynthesis fused ATPase/permease subunit